MKMKEIKKKFKRFLAGGLMVCLMMPSFAGATWADVETYDYTGITRAVSYTHLDVYKRQGEFFTIGILHLFVQIVQYLQSFISLQIHKI